MSGEDFVSTVKLVGQEKLEGGISTVFTYDIAPSSFPSTRLELLSNAFQHYKFQNVQIIFKPSIPDSINGQYVAYFDTDPNDEPNYNSAEDVLKIASSHIGAKKSAVNKGWSINLPIKTDNTLLYTVPSTKSDRRTYVQSTFRLIQIGQCTDYLGKAIEKSIVAGTISIKWTIRFDKPQLSSLDRIVDGESQKNIIRLFKTLDFYRTFPTGNITYTSHIANTPYRTFKYVLSHDMFSGPGSWLVQKIPVSMVMPNTVKAVKTYSPNLEEGDINSYKTLSTLVADGATTTDKVISWVVKTFKDVAGGIVAAVELFDVIGAILPLFVAGQATGTQVNATYDNSDTAHSYNPIGYTVVQYKGANSKLPIIDEIFEFNDVAHAADSTITISYTSVLMFYKLDELLDKNKKYASCVVPLRVLDQ
jgi:hypothetical protein